MSVDSVSPQVEVGGTQATANPPHRRRPRSLHHLRHLYPLIALLVVLGLWEGIVRLFSINHVILPPPSEIFQSIGHDHALLFRYSQTTVVEILVGFGLAVGIGTPLGALIVFSPPAKRAIYPLLVASQMVPKVAIAPVLVVWFGTGLSSKFLVAFLIAFFPIMIATAVGLESIDDDMVRLFRSMGAGTLKTFTKLRLPAALPNIFGGLKVAMSLAVVGAIVGEFVAANSGLGYFLLFSNGQVDTPGVFAALFVLTAIGVILYFLIERLEHFLVSPSRTPQSEKMSATM